MADSVLVEDPADPGTYLILNSDSVVTPSIPTSTVGQDRSVGISWNNAGSKYFETGVDRGVLYIDDNPGVPWVGLISISEKPSGGDARETYLDGIKIVNRSRPEQFNATLEAYTYPLEFEPCDGSEQLANGLTVSQQNRKMFGLSYRTKVGNDIDGLNHAYKIHIIYNALASAIDKEFASLSDGTDPSTFSWDISTRQERFEDPFFGVRYGAHLVLDSRVIYPWAMTAVEDVLYGTKTVPGRLPSPQELLGLFVDNALVKVTDNGDGTFSITGPDSIIEMLQSDLFQIDWPSAVMVDEETYTITSL